MWWLMAAALAEPAGNFEEAGGGNSRLDDRGGLAAHRAGDARHR